LPTCACCASPTTTASKRRSGAQSKKQLLPEAKVELTFERRRPPLEASAASIAMAKHAQGIYREMGMDLVVDAIAGGRRHRRSFRCAEDAERRRRAPSACAASARIRAAMNMS